MASFAEYTKNQNKKKKKKQEQSAAGMSFTDYTKQKLGRDDIEAPLTQRNDNDIAPVSNEKTSAWDSLLQNAKDTAKWKKEQQKKYPEYYAMEEQIKKQFPGAQVTFDPEKDEQYRKNESYSIGGKQYKYNKMIFEVTVGEKDQKQKFKLYYDRDTGKTKIREQKEERTWFDDAAFDDGYDFGDITTSLLGTAKDTSEELYEGLFNIGETVIDAGATGIGWVGGLFSDDFEKDMGKFVAKDLINEEAVAKHFVNAQSLGTGYLFDEYIADGDSDNVSFLGEKLDSLANSAGQLAGQLALSPVVPWYVTTGVTSFGSGTEQALQSGASFDEAKWQGAIQAGADILTEKLFKGSGLGEKGLVDTSVITRGISNKTLKTFADFGVDVLSEGGEEVAASFMTRLGSALYKEENLGELLASEEAFDEYLESFIGGGVLSGGVNVGKAYNSIKTKTDYNTGLNINEEKVFKKAYEQAIAEAEKDGKKLSKKDKAKLYDDVMNKLQRGEIDIDTIEEVLGGDDYKAYTDAVEQDKINEKKLAEIYEGEELQKQIESYRANSKVGDAKTKLSDGVRSLLSKDFQTLTDKKGYGRYSYLTESYVQREKRGKAFTADLSQYDTKYHGTIKKAVESGILNDTRKTHDFVDLIAKVSADKGVNFDFTNNEKLANSRFAVEGKTVNGYVDGDTIGLNIDSNKALEKTVGHEITHILEGTELYDTLAKSITEYAKSKKATDSKFANEYLERFYNANELYKNVEGYQGADGIANIEKEVAADLVGDYLFTDTEFINKLSTQDRNLFQKIYDEIKYLCKVATAGSKEARELQRVKKAFEDAYREGGKTESKADTKYSLAMVEEVQPSSNKWSRTLTTEEAKARFPKLWDIAADESEVRNPTQISSTVKSYRKVYDYLKAEGFNGTILDASSGLGYGTKAGIEEYGFNVEDIEPYPDKSYNPKYKDYSTLDKKYDVVISNAVLNVLPQDQRDALVVKMGEMLNDGGRIFINVRGKDVDTLGNNKSNTNISPMEWFVDSTGSYQKGFTKSELVAYLQDALGDGFTVKPTNLFGAVSAVVTKDSGVKYSLSTDSEGAKLSKAQQEYFKNSKMRDDNGNLKVMYHGSEYAGFHEFNSKFSDDDTSFFFVDSNEVAQSYSGSSEVYTARSFNTVEEFNQFFKEIDADEFEVIKQGDKYALLENNEVEVTSDTLKGLYEEFCDYTGLGQGAANYKVYLNLTNPLEVDAQGRNWNRLTSEFSQEIYDRVKSLTEEEKTALTQLASWEDSSIFRDEIETAVESVERNANYVDEHIRNLASAAEKLGDIDMYRLFDIATDNFTEETLKENAVKYLNTREYAQRAKEQGYDGVIFKNIVDNGGFSDGKEGASTVAIAFESNQIKSVANDKPTSDADIRYSLSDADYLKAVENGDTETAQRLVDEAAKDSGYGIKAYHGTPNTEFTVFDKERLGKGNDQYGAGFYFASNKEGASHYGNRVINSALNIKNPIRITATRDSGTNLINANIELTSEQAYEVVKRHPDIYDEENSPLGDYFDSYWEDGTQDWMIESLAEQYRDVGYLDSDLFRNYPNELHEALRDVTGYDGVEVTFESTGDKFYVAWFDNQMKSTDPVTYDDNGNVIPLSERFNPENNDIRYSISEQGAKVKKQPNLTYGEDVKLDIAPTVEDIAPTENVEDFAPVYDAPITEDQANAMASESLESLTDADAPIEVEDEYYNIPDTSSIDDKALKNIGKSLRDTLSLTPQETKAIQEIVQEYSTSEAPSKEGLFDTIKRKFAEKHWKEKNNEVADVKRWLRNSKINVSQKIKQGIDGYSEFRRIHQGKIGFSKQGIGVDSAYQEMSEMFPNFFPADIINPADQLLRMGEVADMDIYIDNSYTLDDETIQEAVNIVTNEVRGYKDNLARLAAEETARADLHSVAPPKAEQITTGMTSDANLNESLDNHPIRTVKERLTEKLRAVESELADNKQLRRESWEDYNSEIARLSEEYAALKDKNTKKATNIVQRVTRLERLKASVDADYAKRISDLETRQGKLTDDLRSGESPTEQGAMRSELHNRIVDNIKSQFAEKGFDYDEVLKNAKDLSTFKTVDNTPQRVMEKALGYKQGQILADATVNKVAQNETEGIKWLNSFTDRKNGVLKRLSQKYNIKPGSKESAAAQMYAEGFYVDKNNNIVAYGDVELAKDFPNAKVRENIKGLANDPTIRQIYDDTLAKINESRVRNAYPEIQRLDNYFLHFRAMSDTFSQLGLPFNPNDIRAKDLPTDLNGVTADLKPGQPFFASAMHRKGKRTSFDLLGGLEQYLSSAKNQIYHIDDIQTFRALRNNIAETYGQAKGLENLDSLSEEEQEQRIKDVYNSHLSTFAKFLNEEANVIAGKTALIDRGVEGIFGRRALTFMNSVRKQVGTNMIGFNVSSSMTNFLAGVQAIAKTNKAACVKSLAQTTASKIGSIFGKTDSFVENNPTIIRRKGADRFYRTPYQKVGDAGYVLMSAVDDVTTEFIVRAKYNEFLKQGMSEEKAITEADKWTSRLMGDRSLGQMPQLYNSKTLGLITQFQLEVRNQLDSQFYDTIQETKASNEDIQNGLKRNAKTAAKVTKTFFELAVLQHLFGTGFEAVAGYNPAFDIIGVLSTALGFDDDEDSEDTALDNIEQGFFELLEDLPYTSTITNGGRIPISSALPITEFVKGEDEYGNEKSRWDILKDVAPYYVLPTGYGQIKKTKQGLSMFNTDEDHPIAGSYTDKGALRFPIDDTLGNRLQAGIFGQWANENAREYIDNGYAPLKEKQIQEYSDVDLPIADYWKYRAGLKGLETLEEKAEYINGLDIEDWQKNLLINNIADRKEDIDMTDYDDYGSFDEFDYASKNPEKYDFFKSNGISYEDYVNADEDGKEAYTWAYNNPEKFTLSKAVTDDVVTYRSYTGDLYDIKADKDANGDTIVGSGKEKKLDYINNLDELDYGQKCILFRTLYSSKDDKANYNPVIIDYLNERDDISYDEMVTILEELDMTVDEDGNVYWD